LLGASPKAIPAYDSYGVIDPKADIPVLEASIQRGFRAIKIKLGDGSLDDDVLVVSVVRDVIGPDVTLMVDYNQSLDAPEAIRRIRAIERFAPYWVEEPVKAEDLKGHHAVRRSVSTAIQTGENWWFLAGMAASLAAEASDFVMPDIMKIGGITGWMEAAALGSSAGTPVSSHLFTEASAHVLAATPTAHFIEHLDIAGALLEHPVDVVEGKITARGPGLGLTWKQEAVKRFQASG
jgi:mandelate racemase